MQRNILISTCRRNILSPSIRAEDMGSMSMLAFRILTPCRRVGRFQCFGEHAASILSPEDIESMFFQNVGVYLQLHMASQPRIPTSRINVRTGR
jgi:hypothetical protein